MTTLEIFNKITKDGILITDTVIQLDTDTYVTLFKAKKNDIAMRIDTPSSVFTDVVFIQKGIRTLPESAFEAMAPAYIAPHIKNYLDIIVREYELKPRYQPTPSDFNVFTTARGCAPYPVIEEKDSIIECVDRTELEERINNLRQIISKDSSAKKKAKKDKKKEKKVKEVKELKED